MAALAPFDPQFSLERARRTLPQGPQRSLSHRGKRSLAELARTAHERLKQSQENAEDLGFPSQHPASIGGEDFGRSSHFPRFQRRIRGLQLGGGGGDLEGEGSPLHPGTSLVGASEVSLWQSLQCQYDNLLSTMVEDSVDDAFRLAACEAKEQMFSLWEEEKRNFEKDLGARACGGLLPYSGRVEGSLAWGREELAMPQSELLLLSCLVVTDAETSQEKEENEEEKGSRERLSRPIVTISSGPHAGSPLCQLLPSIKEWSLAFAPPTLVMHCSQIWDILTCLCGITQKRGGGPDEFRLLIYNSLQILERLCEEQLEETGPESPARDNWTSATRQFGPSTSSLRMTTSRTRKPEESSWLLDIAETLHFSKDFFTLIECCNFYHRREYPADMDDLWSLAYWAFRCGKGQVLDELAECSADPRAPIKIDRSFCPICKLLSQRLLLTSQSLDARRDHPVKSFSVNLRGSGCSPHVYRADQVLEDEIRLLGAVCPNLENLNPTAALLISLADASRGPISLKTFMPNASTEDFLWYNIHSYLLKPHNSSSPSLVADVLRLQAKVVDLGPEHFGSSPEAALTEEGMGGVSMMNFAKVLFYILRISDALAWMMETFPSLSRICLHWAFYLNKMGLIGGAYYQEEQNHLRGLLPRLVEIPHKEDSLSLSVICSTLTAGISLRIKLPYIQLLSTHDKLNFLDELVEEHGEELAQSGILGSIDLRECRSKYGPLFDVLLPTNFETLPDYSRAKTQAEKETLEMFEGVCINVAKKCFQKRLYSETLLSYFLGNQHLDALGTLLVAFRDPLLFPAFGHLSKDVVTKTHSVLLDYFRLYGARVSELEIPPALWMKVVRGFRITQAFCLTREGRTEEAVAHMELQSLVPQPEDLTAWLEGVWGDELPRLLEAYVFCLYDCQTRGVVLRSPESLREAAQKLLLVCNELQRLAATTRKPMGMMTTTVDQLRSLLASITVENTKSIDIVK